MGLLGNLGLVVVFAWVVRGLLGARSVTWPRLLEVLRSEAGERQDARQSCR
jgi:hypothetical protein